MSKKKFAYTGQMVLEQLRKNQTPPPVLYIFGDDPYQVRELIERLRGLVQPAFKDFNLHQVMAGESSGDQIASLANQLPVMDACTVIIVRDAQSLQKTDWTSLQDYLENPSPTTCLAFIEADRDPHIDSRTKAGKALKNATVSCLKPYENKMPQWLRQRAEHHKLRLHPDALHRMLDLLGTELTPLDNALQRLSLFLGGPGEVTLDIVEQTVAGDRDFNVFELTAFVGQRNLESALRYLRGILNKGEHPLKLLALLATTFRKMIRARVDLDNHAPPNAFDKYIPGALRFQREQRVQEFVSQVKQFTLNELILAFQLMKQTDLALKSTSGLTNELLMEKLILELCQLPR